MVNKTDYIGCIFKEILVQDHFYMKYSVSHISNNNYYILL